MKRIWITLGLCVLAIPIAYVLDLFSRDRRFDSQFAYNLTLQCIESKIKNCMYAGTLSRSESEKIVLVKDAVYRTGRNGLLEYSFSSRGNDYCAYAQIEPLALFQYRYFITLYRCSEGGEVSRGLG